MADQEVPAFVFDEAFLQADLATFDVREDLFELAEGFLEALGRGLGLLCHATESIPIGILPRT